jgi:glutamine phosphoribosylpyrophosphate amidotransferase
MGSLDLDEYEHDIPEGYYIAHQQAPTTENKDIMSVHPAEVNKELLWHNGIIKEDEVARLQQLLDVKYTWDTKLLLLHLIKYQNVDNIDGSFSCVYHDKKSLFLFRNEISPLFYDRRSNISSTKFKDSMSLPPNQILKFIPNIDSRPDLEFVTKFTTKENPYFFIEGV